MSKENLRKEVLIVAGMPSNKKVIKFEGDDKWHPIAAKVQEYDLAKYGIVPKATVDATFDEKGTIVYLKAKKDGATTKTETKKTEVANTAIANESLIWKVQAVAKNRKVAKFEESDKAWDELSDEIQKLDYETIGLVAGQTVMITKDDKGIVTSVSLYQDLTQESTSYNVSEASVSFDSNAKNNSIEAQVAWKDGCTVIAAMINQGLLTSVDAVRNELQTITKIGIEAMKNR